MMRAPAEADAEAVTALVIAGDIEDVGEPDYSLSDLKADWASKDFDLATDAVVVEESGRIVGYAAFRGLGAQLTVDPSSKGRGIGTALREWVETRAREKGLKTLRQYTGDRNAAAREHLLAAGYERERSYWRMETELDPSHRRPETPEGYRLSRYEGHDLYEVNEAAFAHNADYEPETREQFKDEHLRGHNLRADLSLVAIREADDVLAGFALVRDHGHGIAYVDLLAVHPDDAGRGLGSALLRNAFVNSAQAGFKLGRLGVASDNPNAIRLYARTGMTQRWRVDSYAKPL
jgi:mycothiol synthase